MVEAFGWIGKIGDALLETFPHRVLVSRIEAGVYWRRGCRGKLMRRGFWLIWPMIESYEVVPINHQTHCPPDQSLSTQDGRAVKVGHWMLYRIKDPLKLLNLLGSEWEGTMGNIAADAVADVVTRRKLKNLTSRKVLNRRITRRARRRLRRYGVKVISCTVSDIVTADVSLATWAVS